jgi:hypothetical protein
MRHHLLAALMLSLLTVSAHADGGGLPVPVTVGGPLIGGLARYDGSIVAITSGPGDQALITYVNPRPSQITRFRITTGTLLARGLFRAERFTGEAWLFQPCGPVPFPVRGSVDQTGALVLVGTAPRCDGRPAATVMRFEPINGRPPPAIAPPPPIPLPPTPPEPKQEELPNG